MNMSDQNMLGYSYNRSDKNRILDRYFPPHEREIIKDLGPNKIADMLISEDDSTVGLCIELLRNHGVTKFLDNVGPRGWCYFDPKPNNILSLECELYENYRLNSPLSIYVRYDCTGYAKQITLLPVIIIDFIRSLENEKTKTQLINNK